MSLPASRSALWCLATLVVLLAPAALFPGDDDRADRSFAERALRRVRKETLPADAADQMTAGYYEDLFQHSSRTVVTNRLVSGQWATNWSRWKGLQMNPTQRRVDGFLYYELSPDLDVPEFQGRLVTNSRGLADREYALEAPPGVRRIGLLGDSVARGLGATSGRTFEALLEDDLNRTLPVPGVEGYEILNFAVGGYRITQMLYTMETKAEPFAPDGYIVVFSDLTVFRKWGDHIGQLLHDGIDLHYPWLRDLVRRADLRPDDDPSTLETKLAPYREETLRWALGRMRDDARESGAGLVVVLVPTVTEPEVIRDRFAGVADLVTSMDIPVIDILDTFDGIADLAPYRLGPYNHHPTDAGHRLLFERLLERLREDPRAWAIVAGSGPG